MLKVVILICIAISVLLLVIWVYIASPTMHRNQKSSLHVDEARLKTHVETLSSRIFPRDYQEIGNLNKCVDYISKQFSKAGAAVELQEFTVDGGKYFNVIGWFNKDKPRKVIIGAHYDAVEGTPGADDNASGVAGLIELAYLIGKQRPDIGVELVAYSLEEPPFFGTDKMGSAFHAASMGNMKHIEGVIILEMIGYYDDHRGSQSYPTAFLKMFYPDRGNFITLVGRLNQREFTKKVKAGMNGATDLPVYSINAPDFIPGVDFSDHRNYWTHGFNALMVTDTAFYRNTEYHMADDTPGRLDYGRMAKVVVGVFEAIKRL